MLQTDREPEFNSHIFCFQFLVIERLVTDEHNIIM